MPNLTSLLNNENISELELDQLQDNIYNIMRNVNRNELLRHYISWVGTIISFFGIMGRLEKILI
jgi:hypothetical protein